jgi:hypothetical protein
VGGPLVLAGVILGLRRAEVAGSARRARHGGA